MVVDGGDGVATEVEFAEGGEVGELGDLVPGGQQVVFQIQNLERAAGCFNEQHLAHHLHVSYDKIPPVALVHEGVLHAKPIHDVHFELM